MGGIASYVTTRSVQALHRRIGPAGLGHPIVREPGLRARLHFAGLGARVLPLPALTTRSVTTSFGSRFWRRAKAFESPFQGRTALSATEPRSHDTEFPQKPQLRTENLVVRARKGSRSRVSVCTYP